MRRRLKVPLAAGENEFGVQGFRELLRAGAIDIVQADACRTGGISEVLRIAKMARELDLVVAPHTWSDAVAVTANAHVVAALDNGLTVEVDQTGNPFIEELLTEPLAIRDGYLQLSNQPGLGIELNDVAVRRLRIQCYRCSSGTHCCGTGGPVYSARGRISRLLAYCSRTWAVQPDVRLTAKIGVYSATGIPRA